MFEVDIPPVEAVEFLGPDPGKRAECDVGAHRAAGGFLEGITGEEKPSDLFGREDVDLVPLDAEADVEGVVLFDPTPFEGEIEKDDQMFAPGVEGARGEAGAEVEF